MMPISQRGKLGGGVVRETETSMRTRKPRVRTIPPPASAAPASGAPSAPVPRNPASSGEPPGGAASRPRLPRTQRATAAGAPTKGPFQGRAGQPLGAEQEAGIQVRASAGGTVCPPRLSLPVTELETETYSPGCHLPTSPRFPRPRAGRVPPLQHLIRNMRAAAPRWQPGRDGTRVPVKQRHGSGTVATRGPASAGGLVVVTLQ